MTGQNKDIQRLQHIVDYCRKINAVFDALQGDYERFADSGNYQPRDLCCFYILQIGELSGGLSEEFKKSHEEIPWRSIRGMRNIVAHRYGTIDLGTVWEALTDDIPALEKQCRAILSAWQNTI